MLCCGRMKGLDNTTTAGNRLEFIAFSSCTVVYLCLTLKKKGPTS